MDDCDKLYEGARGVSILTFLYHFHPLHKHLEIRLAATAGSSLLHMSSDRARTGYI